MVEQIPLKDKVAGSRPAGRIAEVAKLVDALALGASGVTHGGPNPLLGTITNFCLGLAKFTKLCSIYVMLKEKPIGKVVHWYDKLGVAVVKLNKALKVGSQVKVRRGEQEFTDTVTSMQLDHKSVKAGKKGEEVAIKVSQQVKEGAEIYAIK